MTNAEMHAEVGRVVSEHSEARRKLSGLRSKARSIAMQLEALAGELLSGNLQGTVSSAPDGFVVVHNGQPREFSVPDRHSVVALVNDLHEAHDRVEELNRQRRTLNID